MDALTLNKNITLAQVPETAKLLKQQIVDGEVDPIAADYFLKCMEELVKVRKDKQVLEVVIKEAEKYAGQTYNGAFPKVITKQNPQIKDVILNELKQKVKDREKLLKSVTENTKVIDPDTGEELHPYTYKISQYISWVK